MVDMRTSIIATLKNVAPSEREHTIKMLGKIGIEITDEDFLPPKPKLTKPIARPEVKEYNLEVANVCLTCGHVSYQYFQMKKLPDLSGVYSLKVESKNYPGEWKSTVKHYKTCRNCFSSLMTLFTKEQLAAALLRIGEKGINVMEYIHG